jgi:hypothetical protein
MMEFLFQVTLLVSIRVKAETQAEAELKLRAAIGTTIGRVIQHPEIRFRCLQRD